MDFHGIGDLRSMKALAIMPWVAVGGPMALLALLFPSLCGGLMLFTRRWRPVLLVLSINSTMYLAHFWLHRHLFDSWWESQFELWFVMTAISFTAFLRFHKRAHRIDCNPQHSGHASDIIFLSTALVISTGCSLYAGFHPFGWISDYFPPTVTLSIASAAGLFHAVWSSCVRKTSHVARKFDAIKESKSSREMIPQSMDEASDLNMLVSDASQKDPFKDKSSPLNRTRWPSGRSWESSQVTLFALAVCGIFFVSGNGIRMLQADKLHLNWTFTPGKQGTLYSSPLVVGEKIFAASSLDHPSSAELYCLEMRSGKKVWTFNNSGGMRPVLSSPSYFEGRIYIGEGFHQHSGCKLYCISAADGKKNWEFATSSHIESTPNVVDGRIYFGAGEDGLYCVDAETGAQVWHYSGPHVDGCPAVAHNRVYAGSGYGIREVFCVDQATGEAIWRRGTDGASFGPPVSANGMVYFGIGSWERDAAEIPFGAVLCLNCSTGDLIWRFELSNPLHTGMIVIEDRLIFVDGAECYCVKAKTGKLCWKRKFHCPIQTEPVDTESGNPLLSRSVWLTLQDGTFVQLHPHTGEHIAIFETINAVPFQMSIRSRPVIIPHPTDIGSGFQICVGGNLRGPQTDVVLISFE